MNFCGQKDFKHAWTAHTLACLATLADGTELFVGSMAFAAEGPAFTLQPDDGDSPEFAILAGAYADVRALAVSPSGLPPDPGPAFELCIDTDSHPMQRSGPMKHWQSPISI